MSEEMIWSHIKGYEGYYEISNQGLVRRVERAILCSNGKQRKLSGKRVSTRVNNCGYEEVRLVKNGVVKSTFVHILLAIAFIANPGQKPEINHKNGNKLDNSLDNLEWVTHAENMQHAYRIGLIKPKAKKVEDKTTGIIYSSANEAAKAFGIKTNTLRNYLNGNISKNPTPLDYLNAA